MSGMYPLLHPIFVHFTIALLTTSAVLFLLARVFAARPWAGRALAAAFWNLWLGAGCTVATVFTGFIAFDTVVVRDAAVRSEMIDHRNWAWATALICLVATCWSIVDPRGTGGLRFLGVLFLVTGLLTVTGWKGGTLVYGHGVAVAPVEGRARLLFMFPDLVFEEMPNITYPPDARVIDEGGPLREE